MALPVRILFALMVFLGMFILLFSTHLPDQNRFLREVQNLGHVPLFGVVSIAILVVLEKLLQPFRLKRGLLYLGAFVLTTGLGAATELMQYFGPRDADLYDLMHNIIGAILFLGFYATFDRANTWFSGGAGTARKSMVRIAIIIAFSALLIPQIRLGLAYLERDRAFPNICGFESSWEQQFNNPQNAVLEIVEPPALWSHGAEGRVGKVTFRTAQYPGLSIYETAPDWSGHKDLAFSVYSAETDTLFLAVRIDDIHHDCRAEDRFTERFRIFPGENNLRIPLEVIKKAPQGREMDMRNIVHLLFFMVSPEKPRILYFDNIRLE